MLCACSVGFPLALGALPCRPTVSFGFGRCRQCCLPSGYQIVKKWYIPHCVLGTRTVQGVTAIGDLTLARPGMFARLARCTGDRNCRVLPTGKAGAATGLTRPVRGPLAVSASVMIGESFGSTGYPPANDVFLARNNQGEMLVRSAFGLRATRARFHAFPHFHYACALH